MVDVLTPAQRRLNMRRIRGQDTRAELLLRRGLHAAGLRFRLNCRELPGRPDIVLPRFRSVIFVHGCFWHVHACPLFRQPATRPEFWAAKLSGNRARDIRTTRDLLAAGWRVLIVWECAFKGPLRLSQSEVLQRAEDFVRQEHRATFCEIRGG